MTDPQPKPAAPAAQDLGTDAFTNQLYGNVAKHLAAVVKKARQEAATAAVKYAESNDPAHRQRYLVLKSRVDAAWKVARAMLNDEGLSEQTRAVITSQFDEPTSATV